MSLQPLCKSIRDISVSFSLQLCEHLLSSLWTANNAIPEFLLPEWPSPLCRHKSRPGVCLHTFLTQTHTAAQITGIFWTSLSNANIWLTDKQPLWAVGTNIDNEVKGENAQILWVCLNLSIKYEVIQNIACQFWKYAINLQTHIN